MIKGQQSLSVAVAISSCLFLMISLSACGRKEKELGDEPTKYQSQAGLERLTRQAAQKAASASAVNNAKFSSSKGITPASAIAKDIDGIIRPVLVKQFGEARLVSAKGPEAPQRDGEVVEDRLLYSVKTVLTEASGDKLHAAFLAAGFSTSPRLGSKPSHGRTKVVMSLFERTRLRGYSFVIIVDMGRQQIEVESYRLGSKYDRLM